MKSFINGDAIFTGESPFNRIYASPLGAVRRGDLRASLANEAPADFNSNFLSLFAPSDDQFNQSFDRYFGESGAQANSQIGRLNGLYTQATPEYHRRVADSKRSAMFDAYMRALDEQALLCKGKSGERADGTFFSGPDLVMVTYVDASGVRRRVLSVDSYGPKKAVYAMILREDYDKQLDAKIWHIEKAGIDSTLKPIMHKLERRLKRSGPFQKSIVKIDSREERDDLEFVSVRDVLKDESIHLAESWFLGFFGRLGQAFDSWKDLGESGEELAETSKGDRSVHERDAIMARLGAEVRGRHILRRGERMLVVTLSGVVALAAIVTAMHLLPITLAVGAAEGPALLADLVSGIGWAHESRRLKTLQKLLHHRSIELAVLGGRETNPGLYEKNDPEKDIRQGARGHRR